jgi:BirA family transcriptional regulator, biotin operon repressor / biotin---[acetyl-CoA-carboxylase] ligase
VNGPAPPGPWRIRSYARLASTSDLCVALAATGEPEGLAVRADEQSAGRGRGGRAWRSASGNLFLSVLLRPAGEKAEAGPYALLAGVALWEALAGFLPDAAALSLKWPNDVLLGGRKLAGILLESASRPEGGVAWLVIGIGANLSEAPSIDGRASACLADAGIAPPPAEDAARAVLRRLAHWRAVLDAEGFATVRAAWLVHAHPPGAALVFHGPGGVVSGRFAGLTEGGALRLATDRGTETFAAGEILELT